jgi:ribosomal-protein-alanine N-acetyltransferase
MNIGDLDSVMEVEGRAYRFPWSRAIFKDCIKAGYQCWIAEQEGEFVGYAIFINAVEECHLLNLCIDPELQGRGYGRQLLNHVLENAKDYNAICVFLEVRPSNAYAVQLYESVGFNEVGVRKHYYPTKHGREDAVIYAKEI